MNVCSTEIVAGVHLIIITIANVIWQSPSMMNDYMKACLFDSFVV